MTRLRYHAVRLVLRGVVRTSQTHDLVRLGSDYGGWWVPASAVAPGAVAYCAGVGEDITFDLALYARGCSIVAIDPVPRAAAHVASHAPSDERFSFVPSGLAARTGVIAFYAPSNPEHVSYSMTDLQSTGVAVEMPVISLTALMADMGHDHIDILKLDIEGAEYEVMDQMIADGIRPPVLCVEFDQPAPLRRTMAMVRRLESFGYRAARVERFNVTFLSVTSS